MTSGDRAYQSVLDPEPINRLREMGKALGSQVPRRILELYLGDSPIRLASLQRGLVEGNAEEVGSAAHALKGSSANLGAGALAGLCDQLEKLSVGEVPADSEARFSALNAEYQRVQQAMRELLAEFD